MKKVCVVGASSSLGPAICSVLAGYDIHKTNRKSCDVTSLESVQSYFKKFDTLHGLIYCPAIKSEADGFAHPDILKQIMDVNLLGAIRCLQAAQPKMKQGRILVIGSADGTFGNFRKTMYSVSKAALHEYVRCFGAQVKEETEVACLVPGTIRTQEDRNAVADFCHAFMDGKIRNVHAQLIRMDGGHHTFAL